MSDSLSISGKSYIPAAKAGKQFGYTGEYMLMLAREGKIVGQKVGHRWYVEPSSIEAFFRNKNEVKKSRSEMIRKVRKAELAKHESMRRKKQHHAALIETLAILVIGLAIGTTGYLGTAAVQPAAVVESDSSFFERLAVAFYSFFSPTETPVTRDTAEAQPAHVEEQSVSVTVGTTTTTSIIIAPDEVFTATSIEAVEASLSDAVTVTPDPEREGTGIITPHFKENDGEEYRYLLVPINPQGG
jgi:hypothetical protein